MFRWCFFHAQNWREKLGNPVEFVVKRNVTYMQVACPPLRSAHQVIFFFFFHFKVSQKPLIAPSTSSLDSQPRWAFLLGGFIFRVLLLLSPVLVHAKNDKIALWRKITASFFPNAVSFLPAEEDEICSWIQINKKLSFQLLRDVENKSQIPFLGNAFGKKVQAAAVLES